MTYIKITLCFCGHYCFTSSNLQTEQNDKITSAGLLKKSVPQVLPTSSLLKGGKATKDQSLILVRKKNIKTKPNIIKILIAKIIQEKKSTTREHIERLHSNTVILNLINSQFKLLGKGSFSPHRKMQ